VSVFGDNLRALRKSRGYTQEKFAEILDSNQANITAWETGSRIPTLSTIQKIAKTFHVPLSSLIGAKETGMQDDLVTEVADLIQRNPKVRALFDRTKYMTDQDIDVILGVVDAITRERV